MSEKGSLMVCYELYDALGPKKLLRMGYLLLEVVNGPSGSCSLTPMILLFSEEYHFDYFIKSQSMLESFLVTILL